MHQAMAAGSTTGCWLRCCHRSTQHYMCALLTPPLPCPGPALPLPLQVPFFPFLPALSVFVNTFLLGQLDEKSYVRFGWWTVAAVALYALYGAVAQEVRAG